MYKQPKLYSCTRQIQFDSVYLEWRDPVTVQPLHFFTLSKCIQNIHTRYQQPATLGINMPIPESQNPRLVSRLGASRSSYNSKDPPEFGSRGIPDSREALPSFSEYLELFHSKAHSLYLRDRETLKYELSVTRTAQTTVAEKVLLELDSDEWLSRLESYSEFAAHLEKGLSSQKRKLYSRYEREYDKFLCEELGKVRAEERKARADEWDRQSAEWNKVFEGLLEAVESERRYGRERPSTPTPDSCSPQREVRTTTPSLARTPDHSGPPLSIPFEGTRPRMTLVDSRKVSTPETLNPPERVQSARSKASLSSTKPDPPSAPRRLKTSPPSVSRELLPARKLMTEGREPLQSSCFGPCFSGTREPTCCFEATCYNKEGSQYGETRNECNKALTCSEGSPHAAEIDTRLMYTGLPC